MFKGLQIKQAFWKALSASVLFVLVYTYYNSEVVRSNAEDIAFDVVNKYAINTNKRDTNSTQVLLFGVDDLYMRAHHLYDEYNKSNYGYLFPRDHIADFIERLDELCAEMDITNLPKALFVDYDVSFSSLPYGKKLSLGDKRLLEVLRKKHRYTILLPKTAYYNYIEKSEDREIQKAISNKEIIFVSVAMLQSSDDVVRRYEGYKEFREEGSIKEYPSVDVALWQLLHRETINLKKAKQIFTKNDIIANRIWIKSYESYQEEEGCSTQRSYWKKLSKYSANCSLFDIIEEDFAESVLMLGGTHTNNDDTFNVLSVLSSESFTGMDMHANALMTMLHLNGGMQRLSLMQSVAIIFIAFFLLSLSTSALFLLLKVYNSEIEFIVLLLVSTVVLMTISIYLLQVYQLWFNWFVPLVLFEIVEIFDYIKDFTPKIISKIWRKK